MKKVILCMSLVAFFAASAGAEVIYRETFPWKDTGQDIRTTQAAWQGWYIARDGETSPGAGLLVAEPSQLDPVGDVGDGIANWPNISVDPPTSRGRMFASTPDTYAFFTHEASVDADFFNTVRMYVRNSAPNTMHALIQVDGQWYVSEASAQDDDGGDWGEVFINLDGSAWAMADAQLAPVTGGSAVASIGAFDQAKPSGLITGFGWYSSISANHRVDLYEVNTEFIPEPATMSLLAIGGLLALRRRRK
ncbi:MAG: PEP-CTERM sorting domain-containing protein [Phycisphaerae bacterium]